MTLKKGDVLYYKDPLSWRPKFYVIFSNNEQYFDFNYKRFSNLSYFTVYCHDKVDDKGWAKKNIMLSKNPQDYEKNIIRNQARLKVIYKNLIQHFEKAKESIEDNINFFERII